MNKVAPANVSGCWNPTMDPIKAWDWSLVFFDPGKVALRQLMLRLSLGVCSGQGQFPSSNLVATTLFWRVKELITQTLPFSLQPIDQSISIVTIWTSPRSVTRQKWKTSLRCAEPHKSRSLLSSTSHLRSSQEKTFTEHIPVGIQQTSVYHKCRKWRLHWSVSLHLLNPRHDLSVS